jgi:hypothetical protein
MDSYDIKRLALVLSVQAEIEGMKAENIYREQCGDSIAYNHGDFNSKSSELENLAHARNEAL